MTPRLRRLCNTRAVLAVTGAASAGAMVTGVAAAYWTSTSSTNLPDAVAASIPTGAAPSVPASPTNNNKVVVTFTDVAVNGTTITSYNLNRYPSGGGAATVLAGVCSDTNHTVTCTDPGAPDGTYTYSDTALLSGTNWSQHSAQSSAITVDTTPPAVTITAVATPSHNSTPAFSGSYGTATGDIAAVTVKVYSGSGTGGSVVATPAATLNTTTSTWSTAALSSALSPDGTYTVAATQSDTAGNTGTATSTFVVDTNPPAVSAPSVSAATTYGSSPTYVNNESVTFSDTASDSLSGVASVTYYYCAGTVTCSSGGTAIGTSTAGGSFSFTTAGLLASPDGTYSVVATATDKAGNTSAPGPATTVYVDTTPPTYNRPIVNGIS